MLPRSRTTGKELKEILLRLRQDPEAIYRLINLMGERLYKEAYKSLQDHGEAEDAVNLAYFKLWNKADQYKSEKPALPYVLSVIRNYCRDIWRSRQRKPKPSSLYDFVNPNSLVSPESLKRR